jgi:hypothetical protein
MYLRREEEQAFPSRRFFVEIPHKKGVAVYAF